MSKKIAVIQDLSGFGRCSMTVALPVISAMGVQACPLPTAVLSAQTGYESYYMDDYTEKMPCIIAEWQKMNASFDGIYSGFVMSEKQMGMIAEFVDTFQSEQTIYLADPVMGDHGAAFPFYSERFGSGMRELVDKADIITPNYTELCLLTGAEYEELRDGFSLDDLKAKITELGRSLINKKGKTIVVTGIVYSDTLSDNDIMQEKQIGNMIVTETESIFSMHPFQQGSFSGTGDLLASIIIGGLVRGDSVKDSLELAERYIGNAIEDAIHERVPRDEGVNFEKFLRLLIK